MGPVPWTVMRSPLFLSVIMRKVPLGSTSTCMLRWMSVLPVLSVDGAGEAFSSVVVVSSEASRKVSRRVSLLSGRSST